MKTIIYIMAGVITLSLAACKKVVSKTMTVVRDCTGTYLRFDGKDYHVCNFEKVSSFPNEAEVDVTFKEISDCASPAKDPPACYLFHHSDGWVTIEKIK